MVRKARASDIVSIVKLLPSKVVDNKTQKILKQHIRDGLVVVALDDGVIVGVSAMLRTETDSSWTFYYLKPEFRGRPISLAMFFVSYTYLQNTTIYIRSTFGNDRSSFDMYLKPKGESKTQFEFIMDEERLLKLAELGKKFLANSIENLVQTTPKED